MSDRHFFGALFIVLAVFKLLPKPPLPGELLQAAMSAEALLVALGLYLMIGAWTDRTNAWLFAPGLMLTGMGLALFGARFDFLGPLSWRTTAFIGGAALIGQYILEPVRRGLVFGLFLLAWSLLLDRLTLLGPLFPWTVDWPWAALLVGLLLLLWKGRGKGRGRRRR
ncbi:MAG: hypothetical protein IMW86_02390 [Hydrogenibacillus sp.]|nr:hypothetical protein [Hydrogenibacillus sp.]